MELRQLRYFVAVAEELNFGRAAGRLRIAGPSLSQQIKSLEQDLGVRLFDRDRHAVALTATGEALLPEVRSLLTRADQLRQHAAGLSGVETVRLGYVNWRPPDLVERTTGVAEVLLDTWVMPSHTQAARVADHSLDLAICWLQRADLAEYGLAAFLIATDRLYAVSVNDAASTHAASMSTAAVEAKDTVVLIDDDTATWSSWNVYAEQLAQATGARIERTSDSGITGPAFFEHVRRLRRPVINAPKGQASPLPPDLVRRSVVRPAPYWTWSLVARRDETRAWVRGVIEALTDGVGRLGLDDEGVWLPATDPHIRNAAV